MIKTQILLIVFAVFFVLGSFLYYLGLFKPQKGLLYVSSSPTTSVYVNNQLVGSTPYEGSISPGEVTVRIANYETKIVIAAGTKTVIVRNFGASEEASSGVNLSFTKVGGDVASLSIVTFPDSTQIKLDGVSRGFAPIKLSRVSPGEHELTISATGFLANTFSIKTEKGYQLTVIAKLAVDPNPALPEATPTATPQPTMVVVLDTPTGFLRVRSKPDKNSSEVGQVKPGETYNLIGENSGWYEIEFEGQGGWISEEYATISSEVKTQ